MSDPSGTRLVSVERANPNGPNGESRMRKFTDRSLSARYWRTRHRLAWLIDPDRQTGWRHRLACWLEPADD
jgi:hypothetical protein